MTDIPFYTTQDEPEGKRRILQESLRLFARKGLSATSIRDIAQATGMSNPALYKHFATKQAVALVLFERLYRAHLKHLTVALQNETDFAGRFRAFIDVTLSHYDTEPNATIYTTDNLASLWSDMPQDMKARTAITVLRDLLMAGRTSGEVTDDMDLDLQLSLVLGMLGQVTRQLYFQTLKGPAARHAPQIERILRAGLI